MKRFALLAVFLALAWGLWPKAERATVPVPAKRDIVDSPPPVSMRLYAQSQPLAAELNADRGDPARDVEVLHRIFKMYQRALQNLQGSPVGNDGDLARVLTGHNPIKRVFLPPNHSSLAVKGHLVDRWGTPYHVHPRGYGAYEIRSAGPDRKLFTEDDLVANPPPQSP